MRRGYAARSCSGELPRRSRRHAVSGPANSHEPVVHAPPASPPPPLSSNRPIAHILVFAGPSVLAGVGSSNPRPRDEPGQMCELVGSEHQDPERIAQGVSEDMCLQKRMYVRTAVDGCDVGWL